MSSESPGREGGDEPSGQRQLTLDEATAWDGNQCEAISVRYSRRCRHEALPGVPYCPDHYHLLGTDGQKTDEGGATET